MHNDTKNNFPRLASLVVVVTIICLTAVIAWPQSEDYSPLRPEEIGTPFPLKRIGQLSRAPTIIHTTAGPQGSTLTVQDGRPVLTGKDRRNKTWSVHLFVIPACAAAEGVSVYEGDLDQNQIIDLVLLRPTCGNGLAPPVHIVIIAFDGSGRPVPFGAEGYFVGGERSIDGLVDLSKDGKADLISMHLDDGYWITNIYSIEEGRWRRQKKLGGQMFPLYTRFTNTLNKRTVVPPSNLHPWTPDLSSTDSVITGVLAGWWWPNPGAKSHPATDIKDFDLHLSILKPDGASTTCTASRWTDTAYLVLDMTESREVIHLSEDARPLLDPLFARISDEKRIIHAFGQQYADQCSPTLFWVE